MSNAAPNTSVIIEEVRNDDWTNPDSGMGVLGKDPRMGWVPFSRRRNQLHLQELWLGDGLAGRIVEHPANEMTREGAEVSLGAGLEAQQARLKADLDELGVWAKIAQALKYENAYGGGGLVMDLDDGMPWSEPVDVARLESVRAIYVATPDELRALSYFAAGTGKLAGKPAVYHWQPASMPSAMGGNTFRTVHASRVLAFPGIVVDDQRLVANGGWGDSLLARCEERIRDTAAALAGAGVALQNFSQDVVSMEKLAGYQADKKGKAELEERAAIMRRTKSLLGLLLLGPGETYTRQPISMAGVADTLHELAAFLCAITSMPMAILMGYSEAGLGDAASSQRRIWHDAVASMQSTRVKPPLNQLVRLMLLSKKGPTGGVEPPDWLLEFNPLEKPTQAEKDNRRKLFADIDNIYLTHQVVRPEHIAANRFNGPEGFNPVLPPDPYMQPLPPYEEPPAEPGAEPTSEPAPSTEPAPEPSAAQPAEPAAPGTRPAETNVQQLSLNGAQMDAAKGIVQDVAMRKMPRDSGVAMLRAFVNLSPAMAEEVMGDVGRTFFVSPDGAPAPETPPTVAAPRGDSADAYARLLVQELKQGTLPAEEVERKVAKLYGVTPRQARGLMKKLGRRDARADAGRTDFPRPGDNKSVGLRASRFATFDPAYAADLKENWPEVWALGGNVLGNRQYERLAPLARGGGAADSPTEEHAIRLREAWAARHAKNKRPAGVVALVKWLVVGRLGEDGMKRVLEAAKDKVRAARQSGGK